MKSIIFKLSQLPLLPYSIGGCGKVLSLNDEAIKWGNDPNRVKELPCLNDMHMHLKKTYEKYCGKEIEEEDLVSAYRFIVSQLWSYLTDKKDVEEFISSLGDEELTQLCEQVDMFYEIQGKAIAAEEKEKEKR